MDSGVVDRAFDFQSGDVGGCCDITNGFHHQDNITREEGQDHWAVNLKSEGVDPDEGCSWSLVNTGSVEVAAGRSDDTADQQPDNDGTGLHDWRPPFFTDNDGEVDEETETDELGRSPSIAFSARGADTAGTTDKVLEAGLDQGDSDQENDRTGDDRRKETLQDLGRHEGESDFQKTTHTRGGNDCTVTVGTGKLSTVCGGWTEAGLVHHWETLGDNGDGRKGGTDNGKQACADVVGREGDFETGDLDAGEEAGDHEGDGDQVLCVERVQVGVTGDQERWRAETSQHGKSVLQAEDQAEKDRDLVVEAKKGLLLLLSEEGKRWGEQVRVVVVSEKTVLGSPLAEHLLGILFGVETDLLTVERDVGVAGIVCELDAGIGWRLGSGVLVGFDSLLLLEVELRYLEPHC